ncbi:MAG: hypothetical protein CMG07_05635 [Candidatus Marinimicrobia bacterium]|nr:hypothetical protein [Candidatus Neomarinimicrobiota bacterium]
MKLVIKLNYKLLFIFAFALLQFCNSPSTPILSTEASTVKVNSIVNYETGGYVRDVKIKNSILGVAADQNGYFLLNINVNDSDSILSLDTLIHNKDIVTSFDDSAYEIEFSNDGEFAFILDPLDKVYLQPLDYDPAEFPIVTLSTLLRSIEVGSSDPDKLVFYSLVKHLETLEGDVPSFSTSIVTQWCTVDIPYIYSCIETSIDSLSYYQSNISFSDPFLTSSNDQLGVEVFKQNNNPGCFNNGTEISDIDKVGCEFMNYTWVDVLEPFSSFDTPATTETVYSYDNYFFAGLSDDKGCYITLLDDNGSQISNLSIAEGYSINDIHVFDNYLVLACKSDGILIYEIAGSEFNLLGEVETEYTYSAKFFNNNTIIAGTRQGIQIINFGD